MRHFNYFENGGPAPSSCISCGAVKELFEVGQLAYGGMAQVCLKCVKELATFIGYAEEAPLLESLNRQASEIKAHEIELARVPEKVEGLIHGIRSSVTDFIFAVSYGVDANKPEPVQDVAVDDSGTDKNIKAPAGRKQTPSKSIVE
jgi:hypothetical protein